ncbi:MAG: tetratricopeptide repeat protein [Pseudomonadota bacterium]
MTESDTKSRQAENHFSAGNYEQAHLCYKQLSALDPTNQSLLVNLGATQHRLGLLDEAASTLKKAVELGPQNAVAHDNLGVVLSSLGKLDAAARHHKKALTLNPNLALTYANYGLVMEKLDKLESAIDQFKAAIELDRHLLSGHLGLGRCYHLLEEFDHAGAAFQSALKIDRENLSARTGLAEIHTKTGRHKKALSQYKTLIKERPESPELLIMLANAYSSCARDHDALKIYKKMEKDGLTGFAVQSGKAAALSNLGKYGQSDKAYKAALSLSPESKLRSNYLFALHASRIKSAESMRRELQEWDRYHGGSVAKSNLRHERDPTLDRTLHIGYLSPDFRNHVVRQFLEPVLLVHSGERVKIFCYSESSREDDATQVLKSVADRWFSTFRLSDKDVAAQIQQDKVDILIDLAGHTANHRLGVMALRPAPVQATYLGYFGSTGMSAIDYWITDEVLHPEKTSEPAVETIYRLPRCSFCYGVPYSSLKSSKRKNPRQGYVKSVVFGCFNNVSKVNMSVIDAWVSILKQCPESKLVLKDRRFSNGQVRQTWSKRFRRRGIDKQRISFLANEPHHVYMKSYQEIDIALDAFPRTGGTTTCDAMWMGVPVITLAGDWYVERLSATKLVAAGVSELVAGSVDEYVEKAVALAKDQKLIQHYHSTLRSKMASSSLCDPISLATTLEDAFEDMWSRYLRNRPGASSSDDLVSNSVDSKSDGPVLTHDKTQHIHEVEPIQSFQPKIDALTVLGKRYGTDKVQHGFTNFYSEHLEPHRDRITKVLEIGIFNGSSLLMWRDYFSNANIYGIDILVPELENADRISMHTVDQRNPDDLTAFAEFAGSGFDLIIDDGGHTMSQQQISLAYLFPHLKSGGVYIVEDLHTSFLSEINIYDSGKLMHSYPTGVERNQPTTYDLVKALLRKQSLSVPFIGPKELDFIERNVSKVIIYDRDGDHSHLTAILQKT